MLTALYTIIVFCLIIAIHEFGHFFVAKLTGVTVHEFSIGMGPNLFSKKAKETTYSLRLIPIGGYVKLEGEDEDSDDVNAFCNKKPWQRFFILFAGSLMNFVLGFTLFILLFSFSKGIVTNSVGNVIKGSAFHDAGVMPGDVIVKIESDKYKSRISSYNDINYFIYRSGDSKTKFTFKRNGEVITKTITPEAIDGYENKMFGFQPLTEKPGLFNVIKSSFNESIYVVKVVIYSFVDLFTGSVSLSDMSGPVGIVKEINTAAQTKTDYGLWFSLLNVMSIAALISINLGVINLLPLPALDGGRILFVLIEMIRRKPIDREKEGYFHFIGFVLLMILMVVITFSDIKKIFM